MRNENRRQPHQRNQELESLLVEMARDLEPLSAEIRDRHSAPRHPAVFVVGCPRSGTTLTYQWLASLGVFTYPSNFVARFPTAPWLAARIQRLLTDPACDFRGELGLQQNFNPEPFRSRLGKTRGLLAPAEFWYWWRRFLPENETHVLSAGQTAAVDLAQLRAELAAWEAVTRKPLLMKALILNWNLEWLADAVPGCVFVHIRRNPLLNMQSLLEARDDFFGERRQWYSFRPPQYPSFEAATPEVQVAAQVWFSEVGIEQGLARVAPERQLQVEYEELCRSPHAVYDSLRRMLVDLGHQLPESYPGPVSFPLSASLRMDADTEAAVRAAWDDVPSLCDIKSKS